MSARSTQAQGPDPYAILGLRADASPEQIARAYRELAKRHHPDRAGAQAVARMAEINAAYELVRDGTYRPPVPAAMPAPARPGSGGARRRPGSWLDDAIRRSLGPELAGALEPDEPVRIVANAATWDSPHVVLALTDRRLLWLRDDAFVNRIRAVPLRELERVDVRLRRPRRRVGELRLERREGRRLSFAELPAATLADLAQAISAGLRPSATS